MTLREMLERLRAGYDVEKTWHKFLLDAYTGGGGFQGRIKSDDGELGAAAACYPSTTESYIDQYPREDELKLAQRKKVSYYLNHIAPLTDLKLAFMLNKPFGVEGLPKEIEEWKRDVDGEGTTFDQARMTAATRAAILGWCPTFVDNPKAVEGATTKAQATAAGVGGPRLVLMFPANLTEWYREDGKLKWVKVRTDHCERPDPMGDEKKYARFDLWKETTCTTYEIDTSTKGTSTDAAETDVINHSFGRVPLAVCRHKKNDADPIKGMPMHGDESKVARRLFNVTSELDENLRSHAFALLVLARAIGDGPKRKGDDEMDGDDEIAVGTDNAIGLNEMATQKHYYLGPPSNIAESLEKRAAELIREIYRMARVEHVRPAGIADATGIARRYAFASTNAAIAAFALLVAQWEQEVYVLVGLAMGLSESVLDKIRVIAPSEFDIEDLASLIKDTADALGIDLGPTATKALKERLVKTLLPNVDDDVMKQILEELEKAADEDENDEAFDKSGGALDPALDPNADPAQQKQPVPPTPNPKQVA